RLRLPAACEHSIGSSPFARLESPASVPRRPQSSSTSARRGWLGQSRDEAVDGPSSLKGRVFLVKVGAAVFGVGNHWRQAGYGFSVAVEKRLTGNGLPPRLWAMAVILGSPSTLPN